MLRREDSVVAFIDVQGKLHELMYGRDDLDVNLENMIRCAALLNIPILRTEQMPEKLGPTSDPFRSLLSNVPVIRKTTFSCYDDPLFQKELNMLGRRQVILTGIEAHICVYQTAVALLKANVEVVVAADAVSSRKKEHARLALDAMRDAGARILPTEAILFSLVRDASDPLFKEVLKLIK